MSFFIQDMPQTPAEHRRASAAAKQAHFATLRADAAAAEAVRVEQFRVQARREVTDLRAQFALPAAVK